MAIENDCDTSTIVWLLPWFRDLEVAPMYKSSKKRKAEVIGGGKRKGGDSE